MAVRPNTDGKLSRASDLPDNATGWTLCCWTRITSTEAAVRVLAGVEGAGGIFDFLLLDTSSAVLAFFHNAGGAFSSFNVATLTVDTWYFVAIRMISGTQVEVLYRALGDAALSTTGVQAIANTPPPTWTDVFLLGSSSAGEEWSNGEAHDMKLWHATLTSTEILAESLSGPPVRTANLDSYLTLYDATDPGDDESGNARDWTASGTFATIDIDPTGSRRRKRGRATSDDSAISLPQRKPLLAAALGVPTLAFVPRRRFASGAPVSSAALPRRIVPLAALSPVPLPYVPRRRRVYDDALPSVTPMLGVLPQHRALSLAAVDGGPPVVPSVVSTRPRMDLRRNRGRWR